MKICVLPGDGIGPEIMAEAVRVLECARPEIRDGRSLARRLRGRCDRQPVSGSDAETRAARPMPCCSAPSAARKWDSLPREQRPERGLLGIRKELGLFANLRPAILYPELANASTLKPEVVAGLDILIVRELTGDIYFGQPRGIEMREVNGEQRRLQHHDLQRERNPPHRPRRLRGGAQAQQEGVLGRQDERARNAPSSGAT